LIIGGGLAGLTVAWQAAQAGKKVSLVTKGWGTLHWGSGCVDVLGYYPADSLEPLLSPSAGIEPLLRQNPKHPYALAHVDQIEAALEAFKTLGAQAGYPLHGDLETNWLLPSALGTIRPTCLAPEMMIAGDLRLRQPMIIVGFTQFPDFYPELIADNLACQGRPAQGLTIDVPSLRQQRFVTGRVLASLFETAEFRQEVVSLLKARLGSAARVGFPAVLGINKSLQIKQELESQLGIPIFEIPTLSPSMPGIRLHNLLIAAIEKLGGRVDDGMLALSSKLDGRTINAVYTEAAARLKPHHARAFVLATGGILGGGTQAGYEGIVREVVFNLPLTAPADRMGWFQNQFLSARGHPIYRTGIATDPDFRPVDPGGNLLYENLYIAGGAIGNCDAIRERSIEGVALVTGFVVGNHITK